MSSSGSLFVSMLSPLTFLTSSSLTLSMLLRYQIHSSPDFKVHHQNDLVDDLLLSICQYLHML